MKFIYNNPFRVLGISVNATAREKDRNVARAKAFLAGKKQVRMLLDVKILETTMFLYLSSTFKFWVIFLPVPE